MTPLAMHLHFKAVTSFTPLAYIKELKLQEARRLLVSEGIDAAAPGYRVGCESPSHFSREYVRFFGALPALDRDRYMHQGFSLSRSARLQHWCARASTTCFIRRLPCREGQHLAVRGHPMQEAVPELGRHLRGGRVMQPPGRGAQQPAGAFAVADRGVRPRGNECRLGG